MYYYFTVDSPDNNVNCSGNRNQFLRVSDIKGDCEASAKEFSKLDCLV